MQQPTITFVLNGKTYSLQAGDSEAIGRIPAAERQQLIALLEAVKQQEEERAAAIARRAVDKARQNARELPVATLAGGRPAGAERLGSGDVDSLMARLAMEDNLNRKPGVTKQGIYKWLAGSVALVVLLVLIL